MSSSAMLTAGCLFSGMGGLATGFAESGFGIRWANDNDAHACAIFSASLSGRPVHRKDVNELSVLKDRLEEVDVFAGGFPCQSFSQAGDRRGFEDERGRLFFAIPRMLLTGVEAWSCWTRCLTKAYGSW